MKNLKIKALKANLWIPKGIPYQILTSFDENVSPLLKTAIDSDTSMPSPVTSSTPKGLSVISKQHKPYIYYFIENLFKINMSQDALVDIIINDDPSNNQTLIVGRPKVLGSASKQMRHISPYSFFESAIKSTIMATSSKDDDGYKQYIQNLYEAVKPLIWSKEGICLTPKQYDELLSGFSLADDNVQQSFQFKTQTSGNTQNEYHLISNEAVISKFKEINKDDQSIIDNAQKSFKGKFAKYIDYGVKYIIEALDPQDLNSITMTCEALARIILTMFNQDKYVAFSDEGNSLKEEMRVYKDNNTADARSIKKCKLTIQEQKSQGYFKVWHHDEFVRDIEDKNTSSKLVDYALRIRFVDNEGITVQNVSKALNILNVLIKYKISGSDNDNHSITFKVVQYQQDQYNQKYNINVKEVFGVNNPQYDTAIDYHTNLKDTFHYHVAKHLYLAFDYKPLENKVLAPKQKGDTGTIKVYQSATGDKQSDCLIQDGKEYRDLQVNGAKGYNDDAIFRANMQGDEIKASLAKACIKHIKIALIPFKSLKDGCDQNVVDEGKSILKSFIELVQKDYDNVKSKDYNGEEVNLDDTWVQGIIGQYTEYNTSLNLSGVSEPTEDNYDV